MIRFGTALGFFSLFSLSSCGKPQLKVSQLALDNAVKVTGTLNAKLERHRDRAGYVLRLSWQPTRLGSYVIQKWTVSRGNTLENIGQAAPSLDEPLDAGQTYKFEVRENTAATLIGSVDVATP